MYIALKWYSGPLSVISQLSHLQQDDRSVKRENIVEHQRVLRLIQPASVILPK